MSQENVEIVRRALAAARADPEALFSILDEQVDWDYVGAFPEVVTYHGPEAVRGFFVEWSGAFDDFGFEAEEILDAGDFVLVLLHQWGRGKETGARVENRTWQVFRMHGGKVVHCHGYDTKAEALKAARRAGRDAHAGS
jgi:ketosteroid isomerase-like protein